MSKGGEWSGTLHFTDYYSNKSRPDMKEEELLDYFGRLGTNEEEILNAQIFQYGLLELFNQAGIWHEYVVVESTNWYWSFEKQRNAIYVQRSKEKTDVKYKCDRKERVSNRDNIAPEARGHKVVNYNEKIYNIFQWIINRKELNKSYHFWSSNCQTFASVLHGAIVRRSSRRLDNTR